MSGNNIEGLNKHLFNRLSNTDFSGVSVCLMRWIYWMGV